MTQPKKQLSVVDARGMELIRGGEPEPPWRAAVDARVTVHADRQAWLNARAAGIGGSESALVLNAAPTWGSPYQLWSEKAGLVERIDEDNEVFRFGRLMEPHIADEYTRLTGRKLIHLGDWAIRKHATIDCMFATHDRIIAPIDDRGPGILSIKTANIWKGIEWLEYEEPPLAYQVQFQHELACSGFTWGSFAVMIWGKGVKWIDMVRNDRFIAMLEQENQAFWVRVLSGQAPQVDGSDHTQQTLRRLHPNDNGEVVKLPADAVEWAAELDILDAEEKRVLARKNALKNQVRALIGDASEGIVPGTDVGWTYRAHGAKPALTIPEQRVPAHVVPAKEIPASAGTRTLLRMGARKKKAKEA
jgi:putative phage-type endonuclease